MEKTKRKLVEKDVTDDVLCNKCGGSCKDYIDAEHKQWNFNHATMTPEFGYGSVLYDMTGWEDVHLCEHCYAAFEATFVIKPKHTHNILI